MQTGPLLRRKRLGVVPSPPVEVAASPGLTLLVIVNNRFSLYVRRLQSGLFTRFHTIWKTMKIKIVGVMDNIRSAFQHSRMTLNELGEGLGYQGPTATKRAWFLLYRTSDPRISTVLAVAHTLGVKIGDLVEG